MKRLFILMAMAIVLVSTPAFADWSVTATWDRSPGPNLDYEECQLDAVAQCTVQETELTTCTFMVTALMGQTVSIRSYNTQGAYADYILGTLLETPAPADGGSLTIVYVP